MSLQAGALKAPNYILTRWATSEHEDWRINMRIADALNLRMSGLWVPASCYARRLNEPTQRLPRAGRRARSRPGCCGSAWFTNMMDRSPV